MKIVWVLVRLVDVDAASESRVRFTTPSDVTVRVKQKNDPAGTVTSVAGENEGLLKPEPTASVTLDCAMVVADEQLDAALKLSAMVVPVVPPATPVVQY